MTLPWEMPPKVRRRRTGALASNALFSTVLAAIVAGGISFAVAHYQNQSAAGQARSAEQASAALQLETAATGFYQATFDLWPSCEKNAGECLENNADAYIAAEITFNAARLNISDSRASALALQLDNLSTKALAMAESSSSTTYLSQVGETYGELIARCGQLVLAQE